MVGAGEDELRDLEPESRRLYHGQWGKSQPMLYLAASFSLNCLPIQSPESFVLALHYIWVRDSTSDLQPNLSYQMFLSCFLSTDVDEPSPWRRRRMT